MSAIDNAREVLAQDGALAEVFGDATAFGRVVGALRDLIAEHERVVGPITEAQVDAAMRTLDPRGLGGPGGMRAALEAARAVHSDGSPS